MSSRPATQNPGHGDSHYTLSVATFNVSGLFTPPVSRQRAREVARTFDSLELDVVNLQEVHTYGLLRIFSGFLPSLPYRAWKPGLIGPRGGLVTFSSHRIADTSFVPWSPVVRKLGRRAPTRALLDSLHKGLLISKLAESPTTVFNTHLVANTDGDWSPRNRFCATHDATLASLRELSLRQQPRDLVITGDFNVARSSALYDEHISKWFDSFANDQSPTFHTEFLPPDGKPQRIDYLLAQGNCRADDATLMFGSKVSLGKRSLYLSNHLGLRAGLTFYR